MWAIVKTAVFSASKTITTSAKAFTMIKAAAIHYFPHMRAHGTVTTAIAVTSASVTGLFTLLTRVPAIWQSYHSNESQEQLGSEHSLCCTKVLTYGGIFISGLAIVNSLVGGWFASSELLEPISEDPLVYQLLALVPTLLNLKSFTSYNLRKAGENLSKFREQYRSGNVGTQTWLGAFFFTSVAATGYSLFGFYLTKEALLALLSDRSQSATIAIHLSAGLNGAGFFVTLLGRSGSVAQLWLDPKEIKAIQNQWQALDSKLKMPFIFGVGSINLYEWLSTFVGYFTACDFLIAGKMPDGARYSINAWIALFSTITDVGFTQIPATQTLIQCLESRVKRSSEENRPLLEDNRRDSAHINALVPVVS